MNTPEKPAETLGKFARARGGKELVKFKDVIGNACVVETMNLAFGNASLRIGLEKAQPKIQALDARAIGMSSTQKTGLIKYPIPEGVRIDTTMVLAPNQVAGLVQVLLHWLKHGTIDPNGITPSGSILSGADCAMGPGKSIVWSPKTPEQRTVDTALAGFSEREQIEEFERKLNAADIPEDERARYHDQRIRGEAFSHPSGLTLEQLVDVQDDRITNDPDLK